MLRRSKRLPSLKGFTPILILNVLCLFLLGCNNKKNPTSSEEGTSLDKLSCLEHLSSNPMLTDGNYTINHDNDVGTPSVSVFCDMASGGWTRIIKDSTTTVDDLSSFGDTSEISSTFYSDPTMGIGWGEAVVTGGANADCRFTSKFVMSKLWDYQEIKFEVSAEYKLLSSPDNSYGYLYISNNLSDNSTAFAEFIDAWTSDLLGANQIKVNGTIIRNETSSSSDLIGYPFNITVSGNKLQLCMGGEDPGAYNKRYIKSMWIK